MKGPWINLNLLFNGNGFAYPKGMIFGWVSKDGVAEALYDYNIGTFFLARLLGLLDFVLYCIGAPIALLVYTLLFVLGILSLALLTIPRLLSNDPKLVFVWTFFAMSFLLYIPNILMVVFMMILSALQMIVPELTVWGLELHKWGPTTSL